MKHSFRQTHRSKAYRPKPNKRRAAVRNEFQSPKDELFMGQK